MKTEYYEVTKNEDGVFSTLSGKLIDIMNPTPEMICLTDIATGLSQICRFGGQINGFYSVAQHSVLVSHMCPPEFAIYGLLHDASEAYIGDVIKPLKNILGAVYEDIEAKFMSAICDKYNLDFSLLKNVETADKEALEMEHGYLRANNSSFVAFDFNDAHVRNGYGANNWSTEESRELFIKRFVELI